MAKLLRIIGSIHFRLHVQKLLEPPKISTAAIYVFFLKSHIMLASLQSYILHQKFNSIHFVVLLITSNKPRSAIRHALYVNRYLVFVSLGGNKELHKRIVGRETTISKEYDMRSEFHSELSHLSMKHLLVNRCEYYRPILSLKPKLQSRSERVR